MQCGIVNYDKDSGQVYQETTIIPSTAKRNWASSIKSKSHKSIVFPTGCDNGSATLKRLAICCAVKHHESLTFENVCNLPYENIGALLWQELRRNGLDSVKMWKAFVKHFPPQNSERRRSVQMANYGDDCAVLPDIIDPLRSTDLSWLAALTLEKVGCHLAVLCHLARFENLHILTLGSGFEILDNGQGVDDRIAKLLSRNAAPNGPYFPALAILNIRDATCLTTGSLKHFAEFPRLKTLRLSHTTSQSGVASENFDSTPVHGWSVKNGYASDHLLHSLESPTKTGVGDSLRDLPRLELVINSVGRLDHRTKWVTYFRKSPDSGDPGASHTSQNKRVGADSMQAAPRRSKKQRRHVQLDETLGILLSQR